MTGVRNEKTVGLCMMEVREGIGEGTGWGSKYCMTGIGTCLIRAKVKRKK